MQVLGFSAWTLPKQAQDKKIPHSIVCTSFFVSGMSLLIAYGPRPAKSCCKRRLLAPHCSRRSEFHLTWPTVQLPQFLISLRDFQNEKDYSGHFCKFWQLFFWALSEAFGVLSIMVWTLMWTWPHCAYHRNVKETLGRYSWGWLCDGYARNIFFLVSSWRWHFLCSVGYLIMKKEHSEVWYVLNNMALKDLFVFNASNALL